jgi:uncharacterized membrane protein YfhO
VRADYLFQGIYVPAGAHRVELRYRPHSLTIGLLVSLAAALATAAFLIPFRQRQPVITYQQARFGRAPPGADPGAGAG